MASSGKKKGKVKGKTVNLTEFLSAGESSPAPGTSYVYSSKSSWADEVAENEGKEFSTPWDTSSNERIALPTAPKSAQGIAIDKSQLPDKPPYTIYLGNLPFDCSTDDIKKFLSQSNCNVSDVRLPREGDNHRPKGFGYAEIDDIESLYKALALNDTQLRNRRIRVDLASQTDGKGGGGGGFDKTAGDWRKSDRSEWNQGGDKYGSSNRQSESDRDVRWRDRGGSDYPDSAGRDRGGGGFGGGRDRGYDGDRGYGRDRGGGFERNYDQSGGGGGGGGGYERNSDRGGGFGREWDRDRGDRGGYSRGGYNQDYDRGGDRGGYERRGDQGPDRGYDRNPDRGYSRGQDRGYDRGPDRGYDRGQDRGYDRGPDRGYDRGPDKGYDRGPDRGYDRGPDRGYDRGPRREGGYDRDEGKDAWRRNEDGPPRRGESDYGPQDKEPPRERKKLVLQKRTQPLDPAPAQVSSSSIFGGAKPVDTAAKEREIEERLERERRDAEQQKQPHAPPEKDTPRKEVSQEHGRVRRDSERSEGREGRTRHSSSGSGRGGPRPVIMRRESERSTEEEVFHKDDQAPVSPTPTSPPPPKTPTSPRQDDNVKLIPAPPPKVNAWATRSETVASPPAGGASPAGLPHPSGAHDRPPGESPPRRDSGSDRPRGGGGGGGGGGAPPRGGGRGGGGGSAWSRGQGPRSDGGGRGGGQAVRGGGGPPRREVDRRAPTRGDNGGRGGARQQQHQGPPAALPKYEEPKPKDWSDSNKFSQLLEDELGNAD